MRDIALGLITRIAEERGTTIAKVIEDMNIDVDDV
jgi:hypothetical protein